MFSEEVGREMYALTERLFPICRSITGEGVRESLKILQEHIPLDIKEIPTGERVFDWAIPKEWNIRDAYIKDSSGRRVVDFQQNNLSVVSYSLPVRKKMRLKELQEHLHSLPEQPNAIPYITSYYKETWGFCMTHSERLSLKDDEYEVFIDSDLKDGSLTYGELIVPGKLDEEVLISTNICHPSMANNELSGPVLTTFLAKLILSAPRRYTYRFVFVPETIGAIAYMAKNLISMDVIAGFVLACVGDNGKYSFVPTRLGNTYVDKVVDNVAQTNPVYKSRFIRYSFLDRGSDERQYNMPGANLPVGCFSRSKFHTYPEYHTSLDDMSFVSAEGFAESLSFMTDCISAIELNKSYRVTCLGEPQLGKRGLYNQTGTKFPYSLDKYLITNILAYSDGQHDLIDISNILGVPVPEMYNVIQRLLQAEVIVDIGEIDG